MANVSYTEVLRTSEEKLIKQILEVVKTLKHERDEFRRGAVELAEAFEKACAERDQAIDIAQKLNTELKRADKSRPQKSIQSNRDGKKAACISNISVSRTISSNEFSSQSAENQPQDVKQDKSFEGDQIVIDE